MVIILHLGRSWWYTLAATGPPWFSPAPVPAPQTSPNLCQFLYSLSSSLLLLCLLLFLCPLQEMQEDLSPFPTTQELMELKLGPQTGTVCSILFSPLGPPLVLPAQPQIFVLSEDSKLNGLAIIGAHSCVTVLEKKLHDLGYQV